MKEEKFSVVRARLPTDTLDQAMEVIEAMNLTKSMVIQDLFQYIATYREIPFSKEEVLTLKKE